MKPNNKNSEIEDNKNTEKTLVDPMVVEDDSVLAKKKSTWDMIFLLCPEQAESIIKAYEEHGPEAMSKAKIIIAYETDEATA